MSSSQGGVRTPAPVPHIRPCYLQYLRAESIASKLGIGD